jgi:PPOX class probable F420-dependent enzyme
MAKMTESEMYGFIDGHPARTAKLATVKADGSPHVAPVWVALDGTEVVFTTHDTSLKGRTLRRDPRVAMSFDDERPPFSFVIVEGIATVSEDPDPLLHWATVIGGRYMGADLAEQYGRRNGVRGELLVRVRPSRMIGQRDIAA